MTEIEEAYAQIDPALLGVIRKALVNIRQYHEKQIQNSWFTSTTDGTMLGQKVTPLNRVGVYVPVEKQFYPVFCTDEYCTCESGRSPAYCYDNTARKGMAKYALPHW